MTCLRGDMPTNLATPFRRRHANLHKVIIISKRPKRASRPDNIMIEGTPRTGSTKKPCIRFNVESLMCGVTTQGVA